MPEWAYLFFYSRTDRMQAQPDKNELFIAGLYASTTRRSNEEQERVERATAATQRTSYTNV